MTGTFWAILPPVIAIVLALITKEVYLSLMIGIASGALMYHNFHLIKAMDTIFAIMGEKIGANCDILIFLCGIHNHLNQIGLQYHGLSVFDNVF